MDFMDHSAEGKDAMHLMISTVRPKVSSKPRWWAGEGWVTYILRWNVQEGRKEFERVFESSRADGDGGGTEGLQLPERTRPR